MTKDRLTLPGQKVYIDVAVAVPVFKTYTYAVTDPFISMISSGKRVLVPFKTRQLTGYILGESQPDSGFEAKCILDVLDDEPLFPESMVPFFRWISDYYIHPVGEVIQGGLPSGINISDHAVVMATPKGLESLEKHALSGLKHEVLNCIGKDTLPKKHISRKLKRDIPYVMLKQMEAEGYVEIRRVLKKTKTKKKTESFLSVPNNDQALSLPRDRFFNKRKKIIDVIKEKKEVPKKKTTIPDTRCKGASSLS